MPKKCPRCGVKHYKVDGLNCLNCGLNFSLHRDRGEKREKLKNIKEELKTKEKKLGKAEDRKEKVTNWLSPSTHVSDSAGNGCIMMMLILGFQFSVSLAFFFNYIIVFLIIESLILFFIFFIYRYFIYIIPIKFKKECSKLKIEIYELEIKILERNRKGLKEKREEEIKTINENISCLIKEGEKLLIRKKFYDAYKKFENALKIFKPTQYKYEQKKRQNIENVLNSKIEFVGNKINEVLLEQIKLNIEKGEIFKNQRKFKDALQEYKKALNIANEMFPHDLVVEWPPPTFFNIFNNELDLSYKIDTSKNDEISKLQSLIHQVQIAKIKNIILNLGVKFDRLHISEIAEECNESEDEIEIITLDMINKKEIYAEYFKSTKSVVFAKQANIDEIDILMNLYREWEENGIGKK